MTSALRAIAPVAPARPPIRSTRNIAAALVALQGGEWVSAPEITKAVGSTRQAMVRVFERLLIEGLVARSQTRPVYYRIIPDLTRAQQREITRLVDDIKALAEA